MRTLVVVGANPPRESAIEFVQISVVAQVEATYFRLRHSRSTITLSIQRPFPFMLTRTSASRSAIAHARLVY